MPKPKLTGSFKISRPPSRMQVRARTPFPHEFISPDYASIEKRLVYDNVETDRDDLRRKIEEILDADTEATTTPQEAEAQTEDAPGENPRGVRS